MKVYRVQRRYKKALNLRDGEKSLLKAFESVKINKSNVNYKMLYNEKINKTRSENTKK